MSECSTQIIKENNSYSERYVHKLPGRLIITNYRLIFHFYMNTSDSTSYSDLQIPFLFILSAETNNHDSIFIKSKIGENFYFFLSSESLLSKLYKRIKKNAFPKSINNSFAFREGALDEYIDQNHEDEVIDGWALYDAALDYQRIGLLSNPRLRMVIQGYDQSPTYPSRFLVPADIDDDELESVNHFFIKIGIKI